jgi:hypothetical protein
MSEQEYYAKDIKLLKERVAKCDENIINSLLFFLTEANTHMSGINQDLEKEIRDEALEFKKKCSCQPNPWKKTVREKHD